MQTAKYLNSIFISLAFLLSSLTPSSAASILAVCSSNKPASQCAASKLFFPTYRVSGGKAEFLYKLDLGKIGDISESDARSKAENVLSLWEAESSLDFVKKGTGLLDQDIDSSNYIPIIEPTSSLGYSPVVWDDDGSITDAIFGKNSKQGVLGFAGPSFFTISGSSVTGIKESQSVFNGFLFTGSNTGDSPSTILNVFETTILHEFGHMFGMDHTQGGNLEGFKAVSSGVANFSTLTDVAVMFPIAANPLVELQHDDIAAARLAYPVGDESSKFGTITGKLLDDGSGIEGASVVAFLTNDSNPRKRSVAAPSDVDGKGQGNFVLPNLVPGDYVLRAEALDSQFTGGSTVGIHDPFQGNFNTGFYQGDGVKILETSTLSTGLSQAKKVTVTAGQTVDITFDIGDNPSSGGGDNGGGDNGGGDNGGGDNGGGSSNDPSFTARGSILNKAHMLRFSKTKKKRMTITNLFPGERLNIKLSTTQPDLITFRPSGTISFGKKKRKIRVILAPFTDWVVDFPQLDNFEEVEIPLTIEDLDTGYKDTSHSITVF